MRALAKYFFQGCLVLVPTMLTGYVVYFVVSKVDALLHAPLPGLGIALTIAAIIAVGALASNVLGRTLIRSLEKLIGRVPLVRLLYTSARDFIGAFLGEERSFDRPAVVTLSNDGRTLALGFITREGLKELGLPEHVMVYFPQSYNFAGNLLVFPRSQVRAVDMDAARFMATVVSGGVVTGRTSRGSTPPAAAAP